MHSNFSSSILPNPRLTRSRRRESNVTLVDPFETWPSCDVCLKEYYTDREVENHKRRSHAETGRETNKVAEVIQKEEYGKCGNDFCHKL